MHETGTGQQVAQLHERLMMMMMMIEHFCFRVVRAEFLIVAGKLNTKFLIP